MININPEKPSKQQSWNSNSVQDRMGFSFRDRSTTESLQTPQVIPRLGYNYSDFLAHRDTPSGMMSARRKSGLWAKTNTFGVNVSIPSIPGLLTYDFVPLFAQSISSTAAGHVIEEGEVPDIFLNVWTRLRRLNNMTEKFMPSDIQWIYNGYMELLTHIENARRALMVMQRIVQSSKSDYVREEVLLSALGFPIDAPTARQNWVQWRNYFNVSILGTLRSIPWFTNLVPGFKRWAGLCKEIYKDDPNRTDYTQLYIFRPRYFWHFSEQVISGPEQTRLLSWTAEAEPYMWQDVQTSGVQCFRNYLDKIFSQIQDLFYSDSASLVIATINAIDARNWKEDQKMVFEPLDFEEIPFEIQGSVDYPFTYDFDVLLSIHNATIFYGDGSNFKIEPPKQNWTYDSTTHNWSTDGMLHQQVWLYTEHHLTDRDREEKLNDRHSEMFNGVSAPLDAKQNDDDALKDMPAIEYNIWIAGLGKVINLPWFNATQADFINATQFTVVSNAGTLSEYDVPLEPEAAGTEILVRECIWYQDFWRDEYDIDGRTLIARDISRIHAYAMVAGQQPDWLVGALQSFALYPITYVTKRGINDESSQYFAYALLNQEDVMYSCNETVLQPIHAQFIRNFWGYPFIVGSGEGEYSPSKATGGERD